MDAARRVADRMNVYTTPLAMARASVESIRATQQAGIEVARATAKLSTVGADDAADEAIQEATDETE